MRVDIAETRWEGSGDTQKRKSAYLLVGFATVLV